MNWKALYAIGISGVFILTAVIIIVAVFVWIPTANDMAQIRKDEIAFFSSPTYCELQKRLCSGNSSGIDYEFYSLTNGNYSMIHTPISFPQARY